MARGRGRGYSDNKLHCMSASPAPAWRLPYLLGPPTFSGRPFFRQHTVERRADYLLRPEKSPWVGTM